MQEKQLPIHLCIGAPRAGSTWLFRELSFQRSLFLPVLKEVRYWGSRRNQQDISSALQSSKEALVKAYDHVDQKAWIDIYRKISLRSAPDADEYQRLMGVAGRPAIDITPAYCFLPTDVIRKIRGALPDGSQVLYIIRDPLDRQSSQIKLHFHMHGSYRGPPSDEDLRNFLSSGAQRMRWNYLAVIENWREVFGNDFHVLNYDRIVEDPKAFTRTTCEILGIPFDAKAEGRPSENFRHSSRNQNVSKLLVTTGVHQKRVMAREMVQDFERFAKVVPNPGAAWIDRLFAAAESNDARMSPRINLPLNQQKLLRMTESLGSNCEYGFFQRFSGYEPSSLFRWAITPVENLIRFLELKPEIFRRNDIRPHSQTMIADAGSGFKFHSKLARGHAGDTPILAEGEEFERIYGDEKAKFDFLFSKFFRQARFNPAVYVIRSNPNRLQESRMRELATLLREMNEEHHLLWVEADDSAGAPVLQDLGDGLLQGRVDRLTTYEAANNIDEEGWARLMSAVSEHPLVDALVSRMIR